MKSSFPKRDKRHSKRNKSAMPMPILSIVLWKRALHIHTYEYLFMCEEIFSKTRSLNLPFELQTHCWVLALVAFWKRALHMYTRICNVMCLHWVIYILYIYMYIYRYNLSTVVVYQKKDGIKYQQHK